MRTRVCGKKSEPQELSKALVKSNEKLYSGVTCRAQQDGITRFEDLSFRQRTWAVDLCTPS